MAIIRVAFLNYLPVNISNESKRCGKHTRNVVPNAKPLAFHMFFLVLFTLYICIYIYRICFRDVELSVSRSSGYPSSAFLNLKMLEEWQKLLIHKGAMVDRYPHGCHPPSSDFSENPGSQALGMSQSSQRFHTVPLFKGHE